MNTMMAKLVTGMFFLALSTWAHAGFLEAEEAYDKGDYLAAITEYKLLADKGEAKAQFNLGIMHLRGQGVPHDSKEAAAWFRKAAEQDDADAQYHLGLMYLQGQGVPQDYKEAASWYNRAAENGDEKAQLALGIMYFVGQGKVRDFVQARKWFNLAGDERAMKVAEAKMTSRQIEEAVSLARERMTMQK